MTTQIKALSKELYEQKITKLNTQYNLRRAINETIANNKCAWCEVKYVPEFRDELSRKEYRISALCQQCQDEVFGKGGE